MVSETFAISGPEFNQCKKPLDSKSILVPLPVYQCSCVLRTFSRLEDYYLRIFYYLFQLCFYSRELIFIRGLSFTTKKLLIKIPCFEWRRAFTSKTFILLENYYSCVILGFVIYEKNA